MEWSPKYCDGCGEAVDLPWHVHTGSEWYRLCWLCKEWFLYVSKN